MSDVSLVNQLNNVFIFIFGAVASGDAVVAVPSLISRTFAATPCLHPFLPR